MISYILNTILFFTAATAHSLKVVNYEDSVGTIVNDLIGSWQSPIVYLKSRGYLPKELQDAPELDFEQVQGNFNQELSQKELVSENKECKRQTENTRKDSAVAKYDDLADSKNKRATPVYASRKDIELKQMFKNLFSSNDENASNAIKTKLDVPWDLNALKSSARQGAKKYLEKFNNKRNEEGSLFLGEGIDADSAEVSKDYPNILPSKWSNNDKYNKPNFFNGVAKILSSPELRNKEKSKF
ncbi:hypothetical protein KR009_005742 [Drosophila setifemur]|nr:hypothetical protein KR009_005742 [Drosophila setifemur]